MMTHCRVLPLATLLLSLVGSGAFAAEPDYAEPYHGLARANGKQIARVGKQWLVVTPDPSGQEATLAIAPQDGSLETDRPWKKIPFLSADDHGLFRSKSPCVTPPSLV